MTDPTAELKSILAKFEARREEIIAKIESGEATPEPPVCSCGADMATHFGVTYCPSCGKTDADLPKRDGKRR
jgi:hypothetical protein